MICENGLPLDLNDVFQPCVNMFVKHQSVIYDLFGRRWPKKIKPPFGRASFHGIGEVVDRLKSFSYNDQLVIYEKLGDIILYELDCRQGQINSDDHLDWKWLMKFSSNSI